MAMEQSILKSTKKVLGIEASYTAFDLDVLTYINSAFSTLTQLGIGPAIGFSIEDDTAVWGAFLGSDLQLSSVKSYVYLKVRLIFDPPQTSYHMQAIQDQIRELEWRLNVHREETAWTDPLPIPDPELTP